MSGTAVAASIFATLTAMAGWHRSQSSRAGKQSAWGYLLAPNWSHHRSPMVLALAQIGEACRSYVEVLGTRRRNAALQIGQIPLQIIDGFVQFFDGARKLIKLILDIG